MIFLYVEDQVTNQEILTHLLKHRGFDIICSTNALEALDYLELHVSPGEAHISSL